MFWRPDRDNEHAVKVNLPLSEEDGRHALIGDSDLKSGGRRWFREAAYLTRLVGARIIRVLLPICPSALTDPIELAVLAERDSAASAMSSLDVRPRFILAATGNHTTESIAPPAVPRANRETAGPLGPVSSACAADSADSPPALCQR